MQFRKGWSLEVKKQLRKTRSQRRGLPARRTFPFHVESETVHGNQRAVAVQCKARRCYESPSRQLKNDLERAKVCAFVRLLWHRPTDCLSVLIHQWACRDTGYTVSISPRLLWHRPIDYLMMRSVLIHQWACRDIGYSRAMICPLYMFRLRSSTATLRCSRILVRQVEARGN